MTSLSQRRQVIALVSDATQAGARQERACWAIGLSERTVQRWQRDQCRADRRPARVQAPKNKLSEPERQGVLAVANSPEFGHLAPSQIVPGWPTGGSTSPRNPPFTACSGPPGNWATAAPSAPASRAANRAPCAPRRPTSCSAGTSRCIL